MKKQMKSAGTAFLPKLRKMLMKYNVAMVMAVLLTVVSCTKDRVIADMSTPKVRNMDALKNTNITDKDVFIGVAFLRGPVAPLLGDFEDMSIDNVVTDQGDLQALHNQQNALLNALCTEYPDFLSDFRAGVTSGDLETVELTLEDAAEKIHLIAPGLTGISEDDYDAAAASLISRYSLSDQSAPEEFIDAMNAEYGLCLFFPVVLPWIIVLWWVAFIDTSGPTQLNSYLKDDLIAIITADLAGV